MWRVTLWSAGIDGKRVVDWPWMEQEQAFRILSLLGGDIKYVPRIQYRP